MGNQKLLTIFFLVVLFFPLISFAGEYKTKGGQTVHYEGLVPCGKCLKVRGATMKEEECENREGYKFIPCQFCHIFVMLDEILDFVISTILIIAVLLVVVAGFLFIIPGKISPEAFSKAKEILQGVALGLVIIFAAWIIVNTIFTFLGLAEWVLKFTGPGKWFRIKCPIELSAGYVPQPKKFEPATLSFRETSSLHWR